MTLTPTPTTGDALDSPADADRRGIVTIGWRERVDLPDWGVRHLKAKIDTGARTSAIHVATIEELPGDRVRFEVVVREARPRRPDRPRLTRWIEAPMHREAVVKPSSGDRQRRPVIQTTIRLGGLRVRIEATLVCRQGMLCRMLVGRSALAGRFHVDPARTCIFGNRVARLLPPGSSTPEAAPRK
jgi:hypothetical protein